MMTSRGASRSSIQTVEQLSAELSRKAIQLDMLESKLQRATVDLETLTKENSSLKRDLTAKTTHVGKLSDQVEKMGKELKQKEYAVSSLQEQIHRKDTKGSSGERSLASPISQRSVSSLSSPGSGDGGQTSPNVAALMKQVEDLKREVESVTMLRSSGALSQGGPGRSPLSRRGLSGGIGAGGGLGSGEDVARMKALSNEIATWKDRAESLMAEVQTSKRKLAAMESEAVNAKDMLDSMSQAKNKAEAQYRAAREEIVQLRAVAEQNSTQLRTELKHSEALAARHASDADTVSTHAENLQKRMSALTVERDAMERAKNDAMELANQAKDAARGAILQKEALEKQLDEQVVAMATLRAQCTALESTKRTSDAQFEALCAKLASAHSVAKMNEANAAAIAGQASNAESDATQMMERLKATQERCDAAELSIEALRAQLEAAQDALRAKSDEHAEVVAALDDAMGKMSAMSIGGDETVSEKRAALSANAVLQEKISGLTKEVDTKESTIRGMAEEMEALRGTLEKARAQLEAREVGLENADELVKSLKSKSVAANAGNEASVEELSKELDAALERAKEATLASGEAQQLHINAVEAAKRANEELVAKTRELDEAREHLHAESERADALSGLLESREEDMKNLRQELAEAKALAIQARDLTEEGAGMSGKLDMAHSQLITANEEVCDLKSDLEAKQRELDIALSRTKDGERKLESLEAALAERTSQIEDLRRSLEESDERLSSLEERAIQAEMRAGDAKSEARDFEIAAVDAKRELERVMAQLEDAKRAVEAEHTEGEALSAVTASDEHQRTEALVTKLKEDLSHVESLLKEAEARCQSLEAELKLEKRRSVAAGMKAAALMDVPEDAIPEVILSGDQAAEEDRAIFEEEAGATSEEASRDEKDVADNQEVVTKEMDAIPTGNPTSSPDVVSNLVNDIFRKYES